MSKYIYLFVQFKKRFNYRQNIKICSELLLLSIVYSTLTYWITSDPLDYKGRTVSFSYCKKRSKLDKDSKL